MSPTTAILDTAVIDELRDLGRELEQDVLGEVIDAYRKLAPDLLSQMSESASSRSFDTLARAAHTLKGGSAQIGAREVCELARGIEEIARAGSDAGLAELIARCRNAFGLVDAELRRVVEEKP
jgi:HPt (histidine-containing phosphotransfer) domain-containing protein